MPVSTKNMEFPHMLYLHPKDKTRAHKFVVVNNEDEAKRAIKDGYIDEPHVPEVAKDEGYEGKAFVEKVVPAEKPASPDLVINDEKAFTKDKDNVNTQYQTNKPDNK